MVGKLWPQPDTRAVAGSQSAPLWPFTWAPEPFLPLDSLHPPHADPAAVGFRRRGCHPESRPQLVSSRYAALPLGHRAPIDGVTNPSRSDAARRRAPRRAVPRARWIGVIRLRLLAIGRLVSSPTTFDNRAIRSAPAAGGRAPRHRNLPLYCYSPWPYKNTARATIEACGRASATRSGSSSSGVMTARWAIT